MMKLHTKELVLFGMLGSMTFGAKVAMMGLPNIEPVSLMVMLFAVSFGRKAVYPIYTYVLLEFVLNGLNLWSINYLYIWLILAAAAWSLRDMRSPLGWAVLSGLFGLLFGALCAPVYLFSGGALFALNWCSAESPTTCFTVPGILPWRLCCLLPCGGCSSEYGSNDVEKAAKTR